MTNIYDNEDFEHSSVKISDDVVAIIAGVAATEIEGVTGMSGGITGGISEMLGMKNLAKGVKVDIQDRHVTVDLNIIVDFGINISELGRKIQENVKNTIETMTGLVVAAVNINIQGVNIPRESKTEA